MTECEKCGSTFSVRSGDDPSPFCDNCAQYIVARLEAIVPEPPNAITYERGVEILNLIQKELYERPFGKSQ